MSQHDLILENGSGAAFRADANGALAALGSNMKGPNAPPAPIAGMFWVDDDSPSASIWTLKLYDGAEWIEVGRLDVSNNVFSVAGDQAALSGAQAFQSNGTFVVPANVYRVRVRLWGSGGGGGGAGASGAAGGGASGAHAFGIFGVTPGQSIPITIGTPGTGGAPGANNGTGGGSVSFGALASAAGGGGGLGVASGFGGPGSSGSASGGALNLNGRPGGSGIQFGTSFVGGSGGPPVMAGGSSLLSTTAGATGFSPGGGGGGGANNNPGGAGAPGLILVEW
jgi:hypothetical protein